MIVKRSVCTITVLTVIYWLQANIVEPSAEAALQPESIPDTGVTVELETVIDGFWSRREEFEALAIAFKKTGFLRISKAGLSPGVNKVDTGHARVLLETSQGRELRHLLQAAQVDRCWASGTIISCSAAPYISDTRRLVTHYARGPHSSQQDDCGELLLQTEIGACVVILDEDWFIEFWWRTH